MAALAFICFDVINTFVISSFSMENKSNILDTEFETK